MTNQTTIINDLNIFYPIEPLIVNPHLAEIFGLEEAIVLQQVYYWLQKNKASKKEESHFHKGRWWTFNSIHNWQKTNFRFLKEKTIHRIFKKLIDEGLLLVDNFHQDPLNRSLWYTINYCEITIRIDAFTSVTPESSHLLFSANALGQIDQMHYDKLGKCNTETNNTETNLQKREREEATLFNESERKKESSLSQEELILKDVLKKAKETFINSEQELYKAILKCKSHHKANWLEKVDGWLLNEKGFLLRGMESTIEVENRDEYKPKPKISHIDLDEIFDDEKRKFIEEAIKLSSMGEAKSWFLPLEIVKKDAYNWILKAPTKFIKEWIERNYNKKIAQILESMGKNSKTFEIIY